MKAIHSATQVTDGQTARLLVRANPHPGVVRALACRADELRFDDPKAAMQVAIAALEAQATLPTALRRPRLVVLTWYVFGSCCRARTRFDEAEFALYRAANLLPRSDARGRAEVMRRLADLRADQRRNEEARDLLADVITYWRRFGGRELGKRLCTSGGILIRLNAYREAAADLEESLSLLAPNGDRFHVSAVANLAACRAELSSSRADLEIAEQLMSAVACFVKPGGYAEVRWHWINGNLLRRIGRFDASLVELETAHRGIDKHSDGFDSALLLLDLTDLHLERDDFEAARRVALSSFSVMSALRNEPLTLRAIQRLHNAAQTLSLDRATVRSVRRDVLASRA